MPPDDPLDALRALHLPPETLSLWSEVGIALAIGFAAAIVIALALKVRRGPRASLRREALAGLAAASDLPVPERRAAQAALLRRLARTLGGDDAARATGAAWATTLDRIFSTDLFATGPGRVFADGLYERPVETADPLALDRALAGLFVRLDG